MNNPISLPHGLSSIVSQYDLIICDLWGVVHDGVQAHPNAIEALLCARQEGVKTIFLSNAPSRTSRVAQQLLDYGVPETLCDQIVTSGSLVRDCIRKNYRKAKVYHLGPSMDSGTLEGLPVEFVKTMDDADVILATGLDYATVEGHRAMLMRARTRGILFLCANPDRLVHVGEKTWICAGAVADLYEELGGEVQWFGKPSPSAFKACITKALDDDGIPPHRVLMIGDSLITDIAGARACGHQSLLIAGGLHREEFSQDWFQKIQSEGATLGRQDFVKAIMADQGSNPQVPDMIMPQLRW